MTEEPTKKESFPEAVVLLERETQKRADVTLKETVRIRHGITGILPWVKIANSAKSAYSRRTRLTVSPAKSRRKEVEKVLFPS